MKNILNQIYYNYYHIEDVVNDYGKKIEQRIVKSSLSDINSQKKLSKFLLRKMELMLELI